MNIRIYNALIMTMENDARELRGEVWISGGEILLAGSPEGKVPLTWDREIDARGGIVLPGFKNAHAHSPMTFLRSAADDLPLHEWLKQIVFPAEAKLTPEDIYELTRLAILEYLSSGITASFDMYYHPDAFLRAACDCGFRMVYVSSMRDGFSSPEEAAEEYIKYGSFHPMVSCLPGFHAEYTSSDTRMKTFVRLMRPFKAGVYMHACETSGEVEGCLERHGCTPIQYFDNLGLFESGGGIFHGVYLSDADMDILKRRGVGVVTCPGSNCKLASGTAPICELAYRNVTLGIGTDGAASNNALDMFREMYLTSVMQKLKYNDAQALPVEAILKMATSGGARIMKLDSCQSLTPGSKADLIIIDMNAPNMQPENNAAANIIYSAGKQNVRLTMIDGIVRYEDGRFNIGVNPEDVYAKCNSIAKRILEKA